MQTLIFTISLSIAVYLATLLVIAVWAGKSRGVTSRSWHAFLGRNRWVTWGVISTNWLVVVAPKVRFKKMAPTRLICLLSASTSFLFVLTRLLLVIPHLPMMQRETLGVAVTLVVLVRLGVGMLIQPGLGRGLLIGAV